MDSDPIAAAVAAEREACAKVCDAASNTVSIGHDHRMVEGYSNACKAMAAAIRARGSQDGA